MSEAIEWLKAQPRNANGKVDGSLVIAEGKRRGYCICPRELRRFIDLSAEANNFSKPLVCHWCEQPETKASHDFWYGLCNSVTR